MGGSNTLMDPCRSNIGGVLTPVTPAALTPMLTPDMQAGTRFTYPGGMEGRVDLVDLITPRPGVEPVTFRSRVRRRTAAPPRQPSWDNHKLVNCHFLLSFPVTELCKSTNIRHSISWKTWLLMFLCHPVYQAIVPFYAKNSSKKRKMSTSVLASAV